MKQIRINVFETNSSSTHSICISKEPVTNIPSGTLVMRPNNFGGDFDSVNCADYLYTAIINSNDKKRYMESVKSILSKHNITLNCRTDGQLWRYSGIDHEEEIIPFLEDICFNEDKLIRFLFGDSAVYTGNDNSDDNDNMCYCANIWTWSDDDEKMVPNPNHDEEHYEYYFKGN